MEDGPPSNGVRRDDAGVGTEPGEQEDMGAFVEHS